MTGVILAALAIGVTWLIDAIDAASQQLGRRDDLNWPNECV